MVFVFAFFGCNPSQEQSIEKYRLEVTAFQKAIAQKDIQLLDVRTLQEYEQGHIKNALLMDVKQQENFIESLNNLDKNKPTYIYCRSGRRSQTALRFMIKSKFKQVYDLKGGYLDWKKHN